MRLNLEGRTALVTGATTGIGRGIAHVLAAEGVKLAIAGRRADALAEVVAAIDKTGAQKPIVIAGDLREAAGTAALASEALKALGGRVDILINNAGASRPVADPNDDAIWEDRSR